MSSGNISELDLQAEVLMKQKEAKAALDKSINELSEKDRVLSEQVKLKETNLADLTASIDKQKAELDKQAEALKNQQDMVEKIVKEKNESMSAAQSKLDNREKEVAKKEEELESKLQKINSVSVDVERREAEISAREFEVENKEKSIKIEVESLVKVEKTNREVLADIKKASKEQIVEIERVRKENAKSKELLENHETRTQEFQEIYKKANSEKTQNQEILSTILMAEERIKLATTNMRQEFERLVAKSGVDLPFANIISPETQEAVGIALLGNVYRDKTALKAILKRIEGLEEKLSDSEKELYETQINELKSEIVILTQQNKELSEIVSEVTITENATNIKETKSEETETLETKSEESETGGTQDNKEKITTTK